MAALVVGATITGCGASSQRASAHPDAAVCQTLRLVAITDATGRNLVPTAEDDKIQRQIDDRAHATHRNFSNVLIERVAQQSSGSARQLAHDYADAIGRLRGGQMSAAAFQDKELEFGAYFERFCAINIAGVRTDGARTDS